MTAILGISAFYHDSAAALVVDGKIVAAAQEERFTRKKHDAGFPSQAVAYCLGEGGILPAQLDYIVFYEKPFRKFDRLLETYLAFAPAGFRSFRLAMPLWLKDKLHLRRTLRKELAGAERARLVFTDHHESHAASAFFPSPFERAAFLTLDGVGEWCTATIGTGDGNQLAFCRQLRFPHSLGLLYSAFTSYCGFKVNSGEYKLMGLAPYGQPVYLDHILKHLVDLRPDGSFRLDLTYFNYCQGLTMTNAKFHQLFGGPPRTADGLLEQRHMDLASSIQHATGEIVLRMACEAHRLTHLPNLVLAGGVALNCVANGRLLRDGPFEKLWIQPAAGDAGGALGAALFVWYHLLDHPRTPAAQDSQQGSLLGPVCDNAAITRFLTQENAPHELIADEAALLARVAQLIADGGIVGWFHGRMEFGPRALGARSLLGDPRNPTLQATMNLKIKFRESFRPFAPCVLRERASAWFALPPDQESPYMMLVAPVLKNHRLDLTIKDRQAMAVSGDLLERVNVVRSTLPAVTHVDFSARVQTVDEPRHGRFYRLLQAFEQLTGCPVLVNTSFNIRGEPIVCTPQDAYRCFMATGMDALVLEDSLILKDQLDHPPGDAARQQHMTKFEPD
ncbi:MAG: carbamoyltransferase [Verrucomicrobia bacterium]|nr:carbamoyltransferase [Verrucomicrobiota bacterium]